MKIHDIIKEKFESHLSDDPSEAIEKIQIHCSKFLSIPNRKLLYRCSHGIYPRSFYGKSHENRNVLSKGTTRLNNIRKELDIIIEFDGLYANRKNSIFCSMTPQEVYGPEVYYIFPTNGAHFTWSPFIIDPVIQMGSITVMFKLNYDNYTFGDVFKNYDNFKKKYDQNLFSDNISKYFESTEKDRELLISGEYIGLSESMVFNNKRLFKAEGIIP